METGDKLGKNMQMIKKFRSTWSGSYAIQRRWWGQLYLFGAVFISAKTQQRKRSEIASR